MVAITKEPNARDVIEDALAREGITDALVCKSVTVDQEGLVIGVSEK